MCSCDESKRQPHPPFWDSQLRCATMLTENNTVTVSLPFLQQETTLRSLIQRTFEAVNVAASNTFGTSGVLLSKIVRSVARDARFASERISYIKRQRFRCNNSCDQPPHTAMTLILFKYIQNVIPEVSTTGPTRDTSDMQIRGTDTRDTHAHPTNTSSILTSLCPTFFAVAYFLTFFERSWHG
jgi:hypothetical protein